MIAAWFAVLFAPPIMAVLALVVLPWIGFDLNVNLPAKTMASFFADSFQRRVGKSLPIVAGEPRMAALIALISPAARAFSSTPRLNGRHGSP